jgi:hypothetical protein
MSLVVVLASVGQVGAWGCFGHIVIGQIAADALTEPTRSGVAELLQGRSLAEVSCWADEVRHSRPETKRWHYVDIQRLTTTYDPRRDCAPTPEGDCLVAAIFRSISTLKHTSKPQADRAEALRFLVHLIGDLHQPLHTADDHDRGGNEIAVTFLGSKENLHAVWDATLINALLVAEPDLSDRLRKTAQHMKPPTKGTITDWALESHAVAHHLIYARLPADRRLGPTYIDAHRAVLERQLVLAGLRLAALVNRIFSPMQSDDGHVIPKSRKHKRGRH